MEIHSTSSFSRQLEPQQMSLDALRKQTKNPTVDTSKSASENKDSIPSLKTPLKGTRRGGESSKRLQELQKRRAPGSRSGTPGGGGNNVSNRANVSKAVKPAEVHFIGELTGCSGFGDGVSCRWTLDYGESWSLTSQDTTTQEYKDNAEDANNDEDGTALDGSNSGLGNKMCEQTHYAYGSAYGEPVWGHPLDFQCRSKMLTGWPRLLLEVFKLDQYGRNDLVGYGVVDLPKTSGTHELECNTWRPRGDRQTEYAGTSFFLFLLFGFVIILHVFFFK